MAMIKQRGDAWQAGIRRKGYPALFRSFPSKKEASDWADEIERDIRQGSRVNHQEIRTTTVRELLMKYDAEVCAENDKNGKKDSNRINAFLREKWSLMSLDQDITAELRKWGKARLREIKPPTHNRDLNLLSAIFSHAIKEWGIRLHHPIKGVLARPDGAEGDHRTLIWKDRDIEALLQFTKFDPAVAPTSAEALVPWMVLLLRHTGLRLGQLAATKVEWLHLEDGAPWIDFPPGVVKNRQRHVQPLSTRGLQWVTALLAHRKGEARLFAYSAATLGQAYRRDVLPHLVGTAAGKGMEDHRLHDLRHTWTTEMVDVQKIPSTQLMKISGRKSEKELHRYYNPTVETLGSMMG